MKERIINNHFIIGPVSEYTCTRTHITKNVYFRKNYRYMKTKINKRKIIDIYKHKIMVCVYIYIYITKLIKESS